MIDTKNITALRMRRQCLDNKVEIQEYNALYRDISPVQNVYWNGFGDPPSITFRANFDDIEHNRKRQSTRDLIKGRFQGGNLGWIDKSELELFAGLSKKPLIKPTLSQLTLLELINREGPLNIGLMKEITGMLVKEITPALHRLQEAFLIYEDQYDGEWDRGWYKFGEMFPEVNLNKYTRHEALKIILQRFAYRNVFFNVEMAKSLYKLPNKDIKAAADELVSDGIFVKDINNYVLKSDFELLQNETFETVNSIYVLHRNDFLVKSNEYFLKEKYKHSEFDILQYILLNGDFCGVVIGKFKNGPYIIEDVVLDLPINEIENYKNKIADAINLVNWDSPIKKYNSKSI